ncbi:MAG: prefoldin subunit alpha [Thermoplasmata archaeon]|nr:prefoldin subunit alpha [Thermoplasmata archaeon]
MSSPSRDLERIAAAIEMLKAELGAVEERLALIASALSEITLARKSLEALKGSSDNEILLPIGSEIRLPGVIKSLKPVVNVGRGVHVEMSVDRALKFLKEREDELKRTEEELKGRMEEIFKQYEALNTQAAQIYTQMKGQGSGNVQIP